MSDLFDHIKDELDKHKNHQLDESVWQRIEIELDQSKAHKSYFSWIPFLGGLLLGLTILGAVWYGVSFSSQRGMGSVVEADSATTSAPISYQNFTQSDTIFRYDTIYIDRYDDKWLTSEILTNTSSIIDQSIGSESMSSEYQNDVLAGAYASGLMQGAIWSSFGNRANLSDLQELSKIHKSPDNLQMLSGPTIDPLLIDETMIMDRHLSGVISYSKPSWGRPLFSIAAVGTPVDLGTKKEKYLHKLWTYGARATLYPHERWQIAIGLEGRLYKGGYDHSLPEALFIPSAIEKRSDIVDFYYKTEFVDIPVFLQYNLRPNRNLQPYVSGGIRMSKITGYGADYLLNDGSELERKVNINSSNFFLNSVMLSSGLSIHTRSGFGAFGEAYYRRQVNLSMLEFEKNNGIGLTVGLFYSFR